MDGETDTPDSGTDNAQPQTTDTPETWDYFDPETDTEEAPQPEGTEDEAGAEPEAQTEAEDEAETEAETPKEPEKITLADGTAVDRDELIRGYQRQADYTRKTQEVANERKAIKAEADRIARITEVFVDHLAKMVPPEPPLTLAYSDAKKYTQERAQYEAALAQVQRLMQIASEPKKVTEGLSEQEREKILRSEQQKLMQALPRVATREGWQQFFDNDAMEVAREVGFTKEDLGKAVDHRLYLLVDLAKDGIAARKAKEAAKVKVEKAPPAAPKKPGQGAKQANRNAEAMKRLTRTGSIKDALAVEWD